MKKLVLLAILFSLSAMASGREGHGGCSTCYDSYQRALKLAVSLYDIGIDKVSKAVPQIKSIDDIYNIAFDRKVLPGDKKEFDGRVMLSFPEKNLTKIYKRKYRKLSDSEKDEMEIHELLVLMEIEKDGVYVWTTRLMKLIKKINDLKNRVKNYAYKYSCGENYCIIYVPQISRYVKAHGGTKNYFFSYESNFDGICKFFNLGPFVSKTLSYYSHKYTVDIDPNGVMYRFIEGDFRQRIEAITCKKK